MEEKEIGAVVDVQLNRSVLEEIALDYGQAATGKFLLHVITLLETLFLGSPLAISSVNLVVQFFVHDL